MDNIKDYSRKEMIRNLIIKIVENNPEQITFDDLDSECINNVVETYLKLMRTIKGEQDDPGTAYSTVVSSLVLSWLMIQALQKKMLEGVTVDGVAVLDAVDALMTEIASDTDDWDQRWKMLRKGINYMKEFGI